MAYTSNMQIKNGLCVREGYEGHPIQVNGDWCVLFKKTRTITKQYTIVGLPTYASARATADAKVSQYTRFLSGPYISDTGQSAVISYRNLQICVAECVPVHTAGCLWQVDINVNEKEERWALKSPNFNPFPAIVPSEYDEPTIASRSVNAEAETFEQTEDRLMITSTSSSINETEDDVVEADAR